MRAVMAVYGLMLMMATQTTHP